MGTFIDEQTVSNILHEAGLVRERKRTAQTNATFSLARSGSDVVATIGEHPIFRPGVMERAARVLARYNFKSSRNHADGTLRITR